MTTAIIAEALAAAEAGRRLSPAQALALSTYEDVGRLSAMAEALAIAGHGRRISFSKKVFIPLTQLCRDVCHYCTFAQTPRKTGACPSAARVRAIARAGHAAGCAEALFALGDSPELRSAAARRALSALGVASTLDYLEACAERVLSATGLLPHLNPG